MVIDIVVRASERTIQLAALAPPCIHATYRLKWININHFMIIFNFHIDFSIFVVKPTKSFNLWEGLPRRAIDFVGSINSRPGHNVACLMVLLAFCALLIRIQQFVQDYKMIYLLLSFIQPWQLRDALFCCLPSNKHSPWLLIHIQTNNRTDVKTYRHALSLVQVIYPHPSPRTARNMVKLMEMESL